MTIEMGVVANTSTASMSIISAGFTRSGGVIANDPAREFFRLDPSHAGLGTGLRGPVERSMIARVDDLLDTRRAWRRPDADPHDLSRRGQALWFAYTPLRMLQHRLIPRGHCLYPPRSRSGRMRHWLMFRL